MEAVSLKQLLFLKQYFEMILIQGFLNKELPALNKHIFIFRC